MRSVFAAIAAIILAMATPALAQTNAESALKSWESWRALSESARTQLAPALVEWAGQVGKGASLAAAMANNTAQYNALCSTRGAFKATAMCQAMHFNLGRRSPLSEVLEALNKRAGTQTDVARDATAILAGLKKELKVDDPAKPQYLLSGFYQNFGACSPPACQPGLSQPALKSWLSAGVSYIVAYGNNKERDSALTLRNLGW